MIQKTNLKWVGMPDKEDPAIELSFTHLARELELNDLALLEAIKTACSELQTTDKREKTLERLTKLVWED